MKLFQVSCFVTENHLHDLMTYLEDIKARGVAVVTVRTKAEKAKEEVPKRLKQPRGEGNKALREIFSQQSELSKVEFREAAAKLGYEARRVANLIAVSMRYGRLKKTATGYAVGKALLREAA